MITDVQATVNEPYRAHSVSNDKNPGLFDTSTRLSSQNQHKRQQMICDAVENYRELSIFNRDDQSFTYLLGIDHGQGGYNNLKN